MRVVCLLFGDYNISMVSLLIRFTVLCQCVWYPTTVYAQPLGRATRYLFRLYVRHWSDVKVIVRYVCVVVCLGVVYLRSGGVWWLDLWSMVASAAGTPG